jgi:hypothetical protein
LVLWALLGTWHLEKTHKENNMTQREQLIEKMASMAVQEGYAFEMNEINKEAANIKEMAGNIGGKAKDMAGIAGEKAGDVYRGGKNLFWQGYGNSKQGIGKAVSKGVGAAKAHPYIAGGVGLASAGAVGGGAYLALSRKAQGEA